MSGSSSRILSIAGVIIGLLALGAMFLSEGTRGGAGASVLARGSDGWAGLLAIAEEQGRDTVLLDQPLEEATQNLLAEDAESTLLVTTFPWRPLAGGVDAVEAIRRFARQGGTVLIGYDSSFADGPGAELVEAFGISGREHIERPPLGFLAWRRFRQIHWLLEPTVLVGPQAEPLKIRSLKWMPTPSSESEVWFEAVPQVSDEARSEEVAESRPASELDGDPEATAAGGRERLPVILRQPVGSGHLILVPVEALSNGRLLEPGNAALLLALLETYDGLWAFDEYAHGLVAVQKASDLMPARAFDLFLVHLAVLYVLGLVAIVRRFGPAWREPPVRSGSAISFLRGLGTLHHRLGHHHAAARLLVERSRSLDHRGLLPGDLETEADAATQGRSLVALARRIASAKSTARTS